MSYDGNGIPHIKGLCQEQPRYVYESRYVDDCRDTIGYHASGDYMTATECLSYGSRPFETVALIRARCSPYTREMATQGQRAVKKGSA